MVYCISANVMEQGAPSMVKFQWVIKIDLETAEGSLKNSVHYYSYEHKAGKE
jgi:hypothetical protein